MADKPTTPPEAKKGDAKEAVRAFKIADRVLLDGELYEVGTEARLTRAQHAELRPAGVVTEDWPA